MRLTDGVIVVGSGASATAAAFPLVRAGVPVLMLDVGNVDDRYEGTIPEKSFTELRESDPGQHRYFLGDDFEGVPFGHVRVGAQLTPPRRFIQRDAERLTPMDTSTFAGMESLAKGGLGAGWGAVAVQFDDHDLRDFPIRLQDLAPYYESVAARIGISGAADDLHERYGECSCLQPPLELDSLGASILERYEKRRAALNQMGVYLGRARLAALTRDLGVRRAQSYHDMDFYSDKEQSVFRPAFAVEELRQFPHFAYAKPYLVERFCETDGGQGIEVAALHTESGRRETFKARRLVIAAGTLGTARIVLRSLERYDTPVPIVSNPYTYVPCIHLPMLGKAVKDRRHSLTQVGVILEPGPRSARRVHAQAYSYRSLLLFKIVKEAPLPVAEGFHVMRELLNSFVILGIHHEDRPAVTKRCVLRKARDGGPDRLEVSYQNPQDVEREQASAEKVLLKAFRKLGCWPLKRIHPGNGASIHYGGTVPMTSEDRELTTTPECQLRGTSTVFLADGSVLPYLPAKALTLTLMANAERVGVQVARELAWKEGRRS